MNIKKKPTDFLEPITKINLPKTNYNEENKVRYIDDSKTLYCMATTFNTTQTYDTKGNPKDRDNDK